MNAMNCACPTCKTVLQIAQALPARVQCPKCSTVFTVAAPPAAAPTAGIRPGAKAAPARGPAAGGTAVRSAPPAAAEPMMLPRQRPKRGYKPKKGNGLLVGILVVAVVVLLVGGGVAAFVMLQGKGKDETQKLPPADGPDDNRKTSSPGKTPDTGDPKVLAAIDKGVAYLKKQLLTGDKTYYYPEASSDVGVSALAGLTLLECNVAPTDPAVEKVYEYVHGTEKNLRFTYSLALTVLFLDRLYQARQDQLDRLKKTADKNQDAIQKLVDLQTQDVKVIQRVTVRLLVAQNTNGGWGYFCNLQTDQEETKFLNDFKAGAPFVPKVESRDDNSINQFVTLALWTARRHQIKTDSALERIDRRYRETQNEDGSWGYRVKDKDLKDATTCAGLIGLAVGQAVKADDPVDKGKSKKPKNIMEEDANIKKGMQYLANALVNHPRNIKPEDRDKRHQDTAEMNRLVKELLTAKGEERDALSKQLGKLDDPKLLKGTLFAMDSWGDLYFLWSLERVAVVYDLKKIATVDWFAFGRKFILNNQKPDGSWQDRFPGIPDTCFALLFLKRANVVKDLTNKLNRLAAGTNVTANPRPGPTPQPAPPKRKG